METTETKTVTESETISLCTENQPPLAGSEERMKNASVGYHAVVETAEKLMFIVHGKSKKELYSTLKGFKDCHMIAVFKGKQLAITETKSYTFN